MRRADAAKRTPEPPDIKTLGTFLNKMGVGVEDLLVDESRSGTGFRGSARANGLYGRNGNR